MSHDERVTQPDQPDAADTTDSAGSGRPTSPQAIEENSPGQASQPEQTDESDTGSSQEDRRRRRLRRAVAAGTFVLVVVLIAAVFLVPVNAVIEAPGPTWNVLDNGKSADQDVLKVSGTETYPTEGALRMTTVSVSGCPGYPVTTADLIAAWISSDRRIVDRNEVCPQDQSAQQVEETGKAQMTASQDSAVIAALIETGMAGAMHLTVTEVIEQQTSTEIQAGDVLETITPEGGEATTITSFSQLRELMTTIPEGTRVTLGVNRGEQQTTAALTTIAPQEGTTGSLLGLSLKISVDSTVEASFGLSDVGGPSAGMMFALGVVDEITPGSLTGGKDISGTGTINMDGQVGPIGGIQQKMAGARNSGSRFFLAPASNCDEVRGHEPEGMQVFAVSTLHEAVTATEAIASGNTSGLTTCSAG
ncbi:PDZ domain-containing protein [Actinomyces sp. oral taxon 170]|jgi:PDZ/DHR/GLGF domain protein|uniref:YlbL family protein n=1 Tax=Actinomyces sp. oral taxon 170 TaxID=712117 RepID=UPI000205E63D|nr:S16 family serine protease [Actinomyces sp. oral taxon 170]EGF54324.1 PDZ domain protein [Actinomyces sp. oral taxon 170 str. F0386]